MGEIRIVGPGKTRGYPYPVCKKNRIYHRSLMQTDKSQPEGKRIMPETRFTEGKVIMPDTRFTEFPALSVDLRLGVSRLTSETDV